MPWIPEHGDALVRKIARGGGVRFHPLNLVSDTDDVTARLQALVYAQNNPEKWRRLVLRKLAPLAGSVSGLVVSFDWHPVMREIVHACRSLNIPTILVPHESVFIDEDRYYVSRNGANVPVTDWALVWGEMQRRIFVGRGYRDDRLIVTGSPKFDVFHDYKPLLDREAYAAVFGLDPSKPIVLFAGQPLDSQVDDQMFALSRQSEAIKDLVDVAGELGVQVLIRQPPARKTITTTAERTRIENSVDHAIDGPVKFQVPPEEALYHAAAVLSINSTMLFEAVLMGRPSISMPYFAFEQIWQNLDIARAPDRASLRTLLAQALETKAPMVSEAGLGWARRELAAGAFDGLAAARVCAELRALAARPRALSLRPRLSTEMVEAVAGRGGIALVSSAEAIGVFDKPLARAFGLRSLVPPDDVGRASGADLAIRLDSRHRDPDTGYHKLRRAFGRPELFVEIGPWGVPAGQVRPRSLVLDDRAAFFDATRETGLAERLNQPTDPTAAERERALAVAARLTGPKRAGPVSGARKVLVVDQARTDRSIALGLAGSDAFAGMLRAALAARDAEVTVMAAPGGAGHLDAETIRETAGGRPVAVIEAVPAPGLPAGFHEVHVVTAEAGLVAALAGAEVHCHGAAFFAGWGFTRDHVGVPFRRRGRAPEDVFQIAWIACSRYFDAVTGDPCEIEALLPGAAAEPVPGLSRPLQAAR